ncbi:hypothetical protein DACRYDRAFT_97454 [Dacryopinax primogenitus]|uniref:Multiple myeloma tumor-associated protein 2-like N-terminal domain-containing protein n=1 Tax=Dacryopinax primogenitus (strain DJM 731) TaxID=1858805 RepID=M5FN41_DACPD|nr:uncharacterized protein DACRYDRAFT_97454 [Dacryopinax primogenitus]EJT96785.1 hypothetical protein DACRYDRAFT_97454 [Dacryopinax primogenitus]
MYDGPIRGGARGGAAEFKWSEVVQDKDRENYLGHSINAPAGRWQKNKDIHWYARDVGGTDEEKREEIKRIKEAEEDALAVALGFKPAVRVPQIQTDSPPPAFPNEDDAERTRVKEEKRKRKEEKRARKEERRARKEEKRRERRCPSPRRYSEDEDRSPSPRRRRDERSRSPLPRERARSPPRRRDRSPSEDHDRNRDIPARRPSYGDSERRGDDRRRGYDEDEMRKERERDRRRWDANAERDRPGRREGERWERGAA